MKVIGCVSALLYLDHKLVSIKTSPRRCHRPQPCRAHVVAFSHHPRDIGCHNNLCMNKRFTYCYSPGQISDCSLFAAHTSKRNYHNRPPLHSDVSDDEVQFVGKTMESFKLADLYWLESHVMALCNQEGKGEIQKLAFHHPTASYLLGYNITSPNVDKCVKMKNLPFRSHRFQYSAEVIASGQTPEEFIHNVVLETKTKQDGTSKFWTLDHDIIEPYRDPAQNKRTFTSSMLMCALSRALPPEPILSVQEKNCEIVPYIIIETYSRIYLGEKISTNTLTPFGLKQIIAKEFRSSWSRRPFQYSGAINLDIAFAAIDILGDLVGINSPHANSQATSARKEGCEAMNRKVRMIDPTCGSGTFLGVALKVWGKENDLDLEVVGVDSNPKCALGTAQNLERMFLGDHKPQVKNGKEIWELILTPSAKATLFTGDSTSLIPSLGEEKFDCGVANLPWNRNTYEFRGQDSDHDERSTNHKILQAVTSILKPGASLVVISGERKGDNSYFDTRQCLIDIGVDIIGQVSVPPAGFFLPKSEKKNMNRDREKGMSDEVAVKSSDCVITVASVPFPKNN